ncbi:DUF5954 family protein [Actinomadura hibisca]|uniref:DUF5954 family protein n=1 Tax=Actinomadura hibisca TaxID=68565 RepID=UPI00083530A2|nr:DUF5954 family protein [Actinomadura hibisca]
MAFPLMPGYDHIQVVADLDPASAVRDQELGERIREYGKIFPAENPEFGSAVQTGDRWHLLTVGSLDPSGARYDLASQLRRAAPEAAPETARAMLAAAGRLDPEEGEQLAKDEWEIGDRRYRIIRVEKFGLINKTGMEPPRPSDVDRPDSGLEGLPLDPLAPAGQWEAQLRLNLAGYLPIPGSVSDQVMLEARHGARTHPGIVLLPPSFLMVEIKSDRAWQPFGGGHGPDDARRWLAAYFTRLLPRKREYEGNPATAAEVAEWKEAAEQIEATSGYEFHVLGRRFRTVRVSRMMRLGADGPEPPRPSDEEEYGYFPPS